jgi:hypothetical protein
LKDTQYQLVSPDAAVAARNSRDADAGDYSRGYYSGNRYPDGYYQGGWNAGGFFGNGASSGQVQRPLYPPNGPPIGGIFGDLRPRYSEDRRWAPPRRVDSDVPWRERQRGDW